MLYILAGLTVLLAAAVLAVAYAAINAMASITATLAAQVTSERAAFLEQIQTLCQRIQAPTQAVVDHSIQATPNPSPAAVNPEDDSAYWDAQGIAKERLAEMLEAAELAG